MYSLACLLTAKLFPLPMGTEAPSAGSRDNRFQRFDDFNFFTLKPNKSLQRFVSSFDFAIIPSNATGSVSADFNYRAAINQRKHCESFSSEQCFYEKSEEQHVMVPLHCAAWFLTAPRIGCFSTAQIEHVISGQAVTMSCSVRKWPPGQAQEEEGRVHWVKGQTGLW